MESCARNTRNVVLAVILASFSVVAPAQEAERAPANDPGFIRLWDDVTPKIEEVLQREDQHEELPESAWFGPDKDSNKQDINALLDEAVGMLAASGGEDYRGRIRELEIAIRGQRDEIAQVQRKRVTAPTEGMWAKTRTDYDQDIATAESLITKHEAQIEALRQEFAAEIRSLGLQISDDQLQFLLSTVIGDDIIGLGVAFDNVKAVTGQLEQLLVDSGEDLTTARRYYGMYTVLLAALERLHDGLLESVQHYLGELDGIVEKTQSLLSQSQTLKQSDKRHQRTLAANIEAQRLTLRTAEIYRDYLVRQAKDVNDSRRRLAHDIAVARNTYETVKVSGELVQLVHSGQALLDALFSREMPAMFTFQNLEMKREFEKLTLQLRESEGD